jgi:hypothetical protein
MFTLFCSLRDFMGIPLIFGVIDHFSTTSKGGSHWETWEGKYILNLV